MLSRGLPFVIFILIAQTVPVFSDNEASAWFFIFLVSAAFLLQMTNYRVTIIAKKSYLFIVFSFFMILASIVILLGGPPEVSALIASIGALVIFSDWLATRTILCFFSLFGKRMSSRPVSMGFVEYLAVILCHIRHFVFELKDARKFGLVPFNDTSKPCLVLIMQFFKKNFLEPTVTFLMHIYLTGTRINRASKIRNFCFRNKAFDRNPTSIITFAWLLNLALMVLFITNLL